MGVERRGTCEICHKTGIIIPKRLDVFACLRCERKDKSAILDDPSAVVLGIIGLIVVFFVGYVLGCRTWYIF